MAKLTNPQREFLVMLKRRGAVTANVTSTTMDLARELEPLGLVGYTPAPELGTFMWRVYPVKAKK